MRLEKRVEESIEKWDMVTRGGRIVIGVSGGPDSLCLLDILHQLSGILGIDIHVAHLDHMLRGQQAVRDAEFVRRTACEMGLPVTTGREDAAHLARTRGLSLEEAARKLRYRFLHTTALNVDAARVAVGHHGDDQVETVLLSLLRGTGLRGLSGMSPVRKMGAGVSLIRPLLEVGREDIEEYCRRKSLKPRTDPTNRDPSYLRNRVRNRLLPLLEREYNPQIRKLLRNTSRLLQEDRKLLDQLVTAHYRRLMVRRRDFPVSLRKQLLLQLQPALQKRILRRALKEIKGDLRDLYATHLEEVLALVKNDRTGTRLALPEGLWVYIDYEYVHLGSATVSPEQFDHPLAVPGLNIFFHPPYKLKSRLVDSRLFCRAGESVDAACMRLVENHPGLLACMDWSRVRPVLPLVLRNRRPGDRFRPLGLEGEKKLKDFFIDRKVPRYRRDAVPLVAGCGERVLWLAGMEIGERYKVTADTQQMLVLTLLERSRSLAEDRAFFNRVLYRL